VRDAYLARWSASETTFGEDKATIAGGGDRTSGPVLRPGSPRLVIQEFWAWLTATQLVRASAAAALDSGAAAARAPRHHEDAGPVTAGEVSFTAARHQAIRSMTWSQVTAGASLAVLAAAADAAASAALHTLITTGRHRHPERAQKARPKFPHTAATKKTVTGIPQIGRVRPWPAISRQASRSTAGEGGNRPARQGRGPWKRTPARSAVRVLPMSQDRQSAAEPDTNLSAASQGRHHPDRNKHLKSLVLRASPGTGEPKSKRCTRAAFEASSIMTETRKRHINQLPLQCKRCTGYGDAHYLTCPTLRYLAGSA
jgi:hypothetical protein